MPGKAKSQGAWQKRLVGVAEIAAMLGVDKSTVTLWARSEDSPLPEPWDTLKLGRVWRYEDIEPLTSELPTPRGRINQELMRTWWAQQRKREARRARAQRQNGSPSTGTSSSSDTR